MTVKQDRVAKDEPKQAPAEQSEAGPATPRAIVGIGIGAASLEPLKAVLARLPVDLDAAYLLAPSAADAICAEDIVAAVEQACSLPVSLAAPNEPIAAGRIYVGTVDAILAVNTGRIDLRPALPAPQRRGTIDSLLISLAEQVHERAIVVILANLGSDGSAGLAATKKFGGLSIVQDQADDAGSQMSLAGIADISVPAERIAGEIQRYVVGLPPPGQVEDHDETPAELEAAAIQIATILRNVTGNDFHGYKRGTFIRRIQRRLQILQIDRIDAYVAMLRGDRDEVANLFQDLLIGVTRFFRDSDEFNALEREIPKLFEGKGVGDQLRVWVLGCATGEEAYSIAILLREYMARLDHPPDVQIFATDLDAQALPLARAGRYADTIAAQVRPDRLERWFVREGDTYCVVKELREMCIFSPHNVIKDAPFSRIDLLSCRNLLIYLNVELQDRVMPIFHFSLRPNGILFLGASEGVSRHQKLFAPIDRKSRLFRKLPTAARIIPDFPLAASPRQQRSRAPIPAAASGSGLGSAERQRAETIAERYAPTYAVVDPQGVVLHFSGRSGRYLEPGAGAANLTLANLVHRDLRPDVRAAIQRATSEGRRIEVPRLVIHRDGMAWGVTLVVEPLKGGEENGGDPAKPEASLANSLIVLFLDLGPVPPESVSQGDQQANRGEVERLEAALKLSHEQLQTTIEELESTNEELTSSNEEYQSINEELQSANEEMETSKEELQSINEELQTVNGELAHRVFELGRSNSDLKNLLESTQIATVFLDNDLRVRNFTPAATDIFHLLETDIGRPIGHVVARIDYQGLADDVRQVLKTLIPIERSVVDPTGKRHFATRILPYRSIDNYINGAVATFTDLTAIHQTQEKLAAVTRDLALLLAGIPQLVWRAAEAGQWTWASPQWTAYTGQAEQDSHGWGWLDMLAPEDREVARAAWNRAANGGTIDVEYRIRSARDGSHRWFRTRATPVHDAEGGIVEWLGTSTDIDVTRRLQLRQEVLVGELQHRVRNILTVIRSVYERTAERGGEAEDVAVHFRGRLDALARTQVIVSRTAEGLADFDSMIRDELLSVGAIEGASLTLSGPDVELDLPLAEILGLAIHELTVNSVKYGALKSPEASLAVRWKLRGNGKERRLEVVWEERNVPAVPLVPGRRGFGRELIEQALPYQVEAVTSLEFRPGGICCTIAVPLPSAGDIAG